MNADGTGAQRLTNNSANDYLTAWSPACKEKTGEGIHTPRFCAGLQQI